MADNTGGGITGGNSAKMAECGAMARWALWMLNWHHEGVYGVDGRRIGARSAVAVGARQSLAMTLSCQRSVCRDSARSQSMCRTTYVTTASAATACAVTALTEPVAVMMSPTATDVTKNGTAPGALRQMARQRAILSRRSGALWRRRARGGKNCSARGRWGDGRQRRSELQTTRDCGGGGGGGGGRVGSRGLSTVIHEVD